MELIPHLVITASPLVDGALIAAFSLAVALLADLLVTKVLRRLVTSTASDFDDRLVAVMHRPVFITVLLFGGAVALRSLEAEGWSFLVLQTLLVVIWSMTLLRLSALVFDYFPLLVTGDSRAGQQFGPLMRNVAAVAVITFGVMGVLSLWNVSVTPLLASAGIIGAAVAFAAKDTISNFLGGISILVDRPYTVGHYVVLESGERGEVADIGLRSTRIKTRDDILITVPNSVMANSRIINESAPIRRFRVRIPVGVAYGTDLGKVERILLDVADGNPGVEKDPTPRVRFRAFGDSSLSFELLCWADDPENRGRIVHELNTAVYERFNGEGVVIPFPQRDVHLRGKSE
jgi:MscS family membrane protein